jgi:hypothetical protein
MMSEWGAAWGGSAKSKEITFKEDNLYMDEKDPFMIAK